MAVRVSWVCPVWRKMAEAGTVASSLSCSHCGVDVAWWIAEGHNDYWRTWWFITTTRPSANLNGRQSHLLWHLTKVADVSQYGALDNRIRQVLLLRVEVRMESVDTLQGGGALLAVAENQVDPQVEVGAHEVALQGLRTGEGVLWETKTTKWSNITKLLNTHFARAHLTVACGDLRY